MFVFNYESNISGSNSDGDPYARKATLPKVHQSEARWRGEHGSPGKHSQRFPLRECCHQPHQTHPMHAL